MRTYQTQTLTGLQADNFIEKFDSAIGTETQTDVDDKGGFIVTCFELEANEVSKCRTIERNITKAA